MHAIETNGDKAAFFSARETPWHRLGTVTEDCLTAEDALRTAHLDWTVEKHPLQAPVITEDGVTMVDVPGKFATIRQNPFTGQHEALGVVGNQYQVVQNADNADFLNALVDESGAHFETAGSLNGGRNVFVTMKVPNTMLIGGHDAVDLFLVATNSHDGSSTFKVAATPTRVVCANTLRMALGSAKATFSTRHTSGAKGRIEEARQALGLTFRYAEAFQAQAERMIEQEITNREFDALVASLYPEGKDETARQAKAREERAGVMRSLFTTAPTQEGIRNTAWGAYNAITEYIDWSWPVQGDDVARAERIALGGWIDSEKQRVLAALAR